MSAEKKTSKGAPFSICERKFPEDPVLTRTLQPVAFSKFAAISFIANDQIRCGSHRDRAAWFPRGL